jgi:cell division protease FtsH
MFNKNKKDPNYDDKKFKYIIYYVIAVTIVVYLINAYVVRTQTKNIKYTNFINMVTEQQVKEVKFAKDKIIIYPKENTKFNEKILYTGRLGNEEQLLEKLDKAKIPYDSIIPDQDSPLKNFIVNWLLLFVIFMALGRIFFSKLSKKMGSGVMSFGKNNAKIYGESETGVTFKDVAGQEEAKESLME